MSLNHIAHIAAVVLGIIAAVVAFAQNDLQTAIGLGTAAVAAVGVGHLPVSGPHVP